MSEMIIGIDFGTSTSLVTVKRYDDAGKPIGGDVSTTSISFGGDPKAETIVRKLPNGGTNCGSQAENDVPDSKLYKEFKMRLESSDTSEKEMARELTEDFLKYLYSYYEHQKSNIGEPKDSEKTIVSYPVKWSQDTRKFMVKAAEKAGFKNGESIDEATAALYAVLC
ncbi:MAG: hypothetical protein LIO44_06650, partial [Eubacterium sp.]|nr:hypothetical protein [Eubacterium sp.]